MDSPLGLVAMNVTATEAVLQWQQPLSSVDKYVLILTHYQGRRNLALKKNFKKKMETNIQEP